MNRSACRCRRMAATACVRIVCGRWWGKCPIARGLNHSRHCEERERRSNPFLASWPWIASLALAMTRKALLCGCREQQQIAVGVVDNKISRAPGFALEFLVERHAGSLKFEEQRLDLFRGFDGECGRQQLLAVP